LAAEKYNQAEPVNLGSTYEISILDLAHLVARLVGYTGKIVFDSSKPDGQPRRKIDTQRATQAFGFTAQVDFETGLQATIDWYRQETT
jgi:GDP-L-fucose synthase